MFVIGLGAVAGPTSSKNFESVAVASMTIFASHLQRRVGRLKTKERGRADS